MTGGRGGRPSVTVTPKIIHMNNIYIIIFIAMYVYLYIFIHVLLYEHVNLLHHNYCNCVINVGLYKLIIIVNE